jgi:transposase InsO family protein
VKKLGASGQAGPGRKLGQTSEAKAPKGSRCRLRLPAVAVDDYSRYAFVEVHPDERGVTCAGFVLRAAAHLADLGVQVERVMTDQAKNYVLSRVFAEVLSEIGAHHVVTRLYRPQTNGKAERFNRTMLDEWPTNGSTARTEQARGAFRLDRHLQSTQTSHRARRATTDLPSVDSVSNNYS